MKAITQREIDFESQEFQENPWPTYKFLRETNPIHWSEQHNCFFVMKYQHVKEILLSKDFTVSYPFRATRHIFGPTIIDTEGDSHKRYKSIVGSKFNLGNINAFTSDIINPVISELVEEIVSKKQFDFMSDFAVHVPIKIILPILGLQNQDSQRIYDLLRPIIALLDSNTVSLDEAMESSNTISELVKEIVEKNDYVEDDSLIAEHKCPYSNKLTMSNEELVRHVTLMLAAGTETTSAAIGNTLICLLKNPEYLNKCRDEPKMLSSVIKESLRWQPPLHTTLRYASKNVIIDGVNIPKGSPIQLCLASANHDEEVYKDPHIWNPMRSERTTMTFGVGSHSCLGILLAQRELEIVFKEFLSKIENMELLHDEIPEVKGKVFRRPTSVFFRVHA